MKKFVFLYYNKVRSIDMPKEERKKSIDKWIAWFDSFKDKIVDGGNPFSHDAMAVTANGIEPIPSDRWPSTGYTIINAEDIREATEIAKGCPAIKDDNEGAVRVYEALPM